MFSHKIKIDKALYERLAETAEVAGYASTEEFITHVLTREVERLEETSDDQHAEDQLRGLGYIE
ncbi:MAG: hypothetical protein KAS72_14945 [Phycisphaerales bacterium]|nr:hypothetical protein [Phycisphaerales bacterium]